MTVLLTPLRATARATGRERSHTTGFWVVALAFTLLMSFATAPTPLWGLFARRDDFGATTVTVAFAVMIIGAAAGLLLFGHLSDRYGRRRIIVPALLVSAASAATILIFDSLPGLLAGRVLTGLGVGLTAATATTYLHDLYHRAHPERVGSPTPGLVASGASLTGLALGPLITGSLAQWAPAPLATPFAVYLAVLGLFALLVLRYSPETVSREPGAARPSRFALRPGGRSVFVSAGTIAFSAFAVMGFFASFGAVMLRDVLGVDSFFVSGLVPFTMFAASALSQTALARPLSAQGKLLTGVVLFPVGLALTATALFHPTVALYTAAAAIAGSGAGLLFSTAMGMAVGAAVPASRAGVTAVFFTLAYIGMGVPSVLFSLISQQAGLKPSMIGFAVVLSLSALTAVGLSRPHAARNTAAAA